MERKPCCEKVGLKKGSWTPEEDRKLVSYIEQHGHGGWSGLPSKAGLQRCGKSCRLRWTNYLRPDIKRGKFNPEEEQTIIRLHAFLGNRWSAIANHLPKRTDNEIKNYWNTHIKKRLIKMGIDPISHRRRTADFSVNVANLSHMTQWENARLEAESRLMRDTKNLVSGPNHCFQNKISPHQLFDKRILSRLVPPQPLDVLKAWQGIMSSNVSNQITLESPTSILNFSNNSPKTPNNVGFLDSKCMSMVSYFDESMIMEQNIQKDSNLVNYSTINEKVNEKIEKARDFYEMEYPSSGSITKENLTTELTAVANEYNLMTENSNMNIDVEVNWNNLLNILDNSSPLDSICFPN